MENIIKRHWNLSILAAVLFVQLLGLAYQVKTPVERGSTRLIRVWAVSMITPLEKGFVHSVDWVASGWHNYIYLRTVRKQNEQLRDEIQKLQLQQVRLVEDASQAHRLQSLLGFKEQYISETMAAQVISSTGSEFTRGIYIDKGSHDGIKRDMPVITASGIVGKVYSVFPYSSLVLEINDPSSGAGVILEKSRLQGILKGDQRGTGETYVSNIMGDEKIEPGDVVLTSGGDRVFPKGLPVGTVDKVTPGQDAFLNIRVKPAAQLNRLEEVLVITRIVEKAPDANEAASGPIRAIDILAQRLPTVEPPKPGQKSVDPPTTAELAARERAAKKAAQQQEAGATGAPRTTPTETKPAVKAVQVEKPKPPAANPNPDNPTKEPPR
jgi:rod shape-determining protein MreC